MSKRTGPTFGFENHQVDTAQVFDANSNAGIVIFSIPGDSTIRLGTHGPGPDPFRIAVELTKREAIFLRNKLTSFIEDGIVESED